VHSGLELRFPGARRPRCLSQTNVQRAGKASAGQGLRLCGCVLTPSHAWAKPRALPWWVRREQSWLCPYSLSSSAPCPPQHASREQRPQHSHGTSRTSWPPANLAFGGSRGSLNHPSGITGAVDFPRNKMPPPKPIKHPSNHQASPESSIKSSTAKFVSLVQLPEQLSVYLKCRTRSFATQKQNEITRVEKALHRKSLNKEPGTAFQQTDV